MRKGLTVFALLRVGRSWFGEQWYHIHDGEIYNRFAKAYRDKWSKGNEERTSG